MSLLSQKTFAHYPHPEGHSLHSLSLQLYNNQQSRWALLADGMAALKSVETRSVDCGHYSVRLQYNPKRIVSTNANVDAAVIRERKCFLCLEHLPAEQQGVLFRKEFLVLCNPMPIFREHYTISHIRHIPQSIESQFIPFLMLAQEMSPKYSVFYNGPKCGASAPDHMHFQASPAEMIPVELDYQHHRAGTTMMNGVSVSSLTRYDRSVLVLEGNSADNIEKTFQSLMLAVRKHLNTNEEPMLNLICSFGDDRWRLIIFLRAQHRPAVYFKEGNDKVMISPASVDMGGLIVTPLEKDFRSTDAPLISAIFREVSLAPETVTSIMDQL